MNGQNRYRVVLALVVMATLTGSALAQKKKNDDAGARGVQGTVVDSQDKLVVGAVVQLKDMRTLQIRSFITQDDGSYHFSGLKADIDYQIKADFQGMSSATKTLSVFDDRKAAIINLKLDKK